MCDLNFQKLFLQKISEIECGFGTRVVDNFQNRVARIIVMCGFGDATLYDGIDENQFDFTRFSVVEEIYKCIVKPGCDLKISEVAVWFKVVYDAALEEFIKM